MTLTYAPPFCTDPGQAYRDVAQFVRRLRHHLGARFPYVWVMELHKDGERLHVHLGLAQYVPKAVLADLWPHGFVDIRRIRTKASGGDQAKAGMTAHYLAKYVGKAFDALGAAEGVASCGRHRYEVGQGFQPPSTGAVFGSESEARRWLLAQEGGTAPSYEWSSDDIDGWLGRPTRGFRW